MRITIKLVKSAMLILTVQIFLGANCNKSLTACGRDSSYAFLATSELSPEKTVYAIGDTIFISSIIPKTLTDQINTSMIIDYSNSSGLIGDVSLIFLDASAKQAYPAKDSFLFVSLIGSFEERLGNKEYGMNIRFTETPEGYKFKGAMVCRKRGTYGLGIKDLSSAGLLNKDCTRAGFNMSITNMQKNLSLWETALNITFDAEDRKKGYAFRVE